tara:strand:+ start:4239 stop:4415 length:177 start_codon:yes stop_codon:yes gene_type:complete
VIKGYFAKIQAIYIVRNIFPEDKAPGLKEAKERIEAMMDVLEDERLHVVRPPVEDRPS